ncbi:hypothetical protein PoB_004742300 [Plakobranchus ocellatus]|uniref:Uncharacterized protein n=1 Tax=Plakobranchus ocellatus TaxID=259542 RepID=A0AAV4BMX2_9GAST|nr:hypothetical protein PoB_004742300 [Plakobranchus ocellatus]
MIETLIETCNLKEAIDIMSQHFLRICSTVQRDVGGTVACESALRSAGTLLSQVRAPPSAPQPDGVKA